MPLREDILKCELPRDRVDRLHWILKTIDFHRQGVKENILYMVEREKKRIMQQAAETEKAQGPPRLRPGLSPEEVDESIGNMEAPAEAGIDYNIRNMPEIAAPIHIPPDASLRDRTALEVLSVVERGLADLHGYGEHMAGIEKYYLDCLERELKRIDEAGKRPEERSG